LSVIVQNAMEIKGTNNLLKTLTKRCILSLLKLNTFLRIALVECLWKDFFYTKLYKYLKQNIMAQIDSMLVSIEQDTQNKSSKGF
jgi:hypothetical protein